MTGVEASPVGVLLRRPWYAWWRLLERRAYAGREYTLAVPQGQRLYTPWYAPPHGGGDLPGVLDAVRAHGRLTVSADRCHVLHHWARRASRILPEAPMAECGVYTGGTAELISAAAPAQVLHLFDSFEGMPSAADPHTDYHRPGDFSDTSCDAVRQRLAGCDVQFHVGFMPGTFEETADVEGYSFVHVDVDIHSSVRDCVAWFWPRLAPGGVVVFDDYGFFPYRHAARRAVDEYFADVPEDVLALPTGQGLVLKDC